MPTLRSQLDLTRCPHCNVDRPMLPQVHQFQTHDVANTNPRTWRVYSCMRCGGAIVAAARQLDQTVIEYYPTSTEVDEAIPDRAKNYLAQALDSLSAPSGAVMLAASSVDAMLKVKELKTGSLYARIDEAVKTGLITTEMAQWAHDVRLDANDERHADESVPLPDADDAKRAVDFALALGQFMFVLPARVKRGIAAASGKV